MDQKRKLILIAGIIIVLAIIFGGLFYFLAPGLFQQSQKNNQPVTITVWGLWEEENLIKPAIEAYQKDHPNITINYKHQTSLNYRSRLQTQIIEGKPGEKPDAFMIHNTWVPMFLKSNSLSPMPASVMAPTEYDQSFNPVVKDWLTVNNQIYAIPRGIDGLALYYNEDILKAAGITAPPKDWKEFTDMAIKMTVVDQTGKMTTAGAAIGGTGNVDHFSDILGLLFLQQFGANLEAPNNSYGADVLRFYTNFVKDPTKKVWDLSFEKSTQSFAQGKVGFYFAPSWRVFEVRTLNPNLKFKTAPVPQLPGKSVAWGTFWAYGVSSTSSNPEETWQFLKYLTSVDTQRLLYKQASDVRLFGLPYSQVSLQKEIAGEPLAGAFVTQAPFYKSWYLASETHDQTLDDNMIKYFEDAVNATLSGVDPGTALSTAANGVQQVLNLYVRPATPPPSQNPSL